MNMNIWALVGLAIGLVVATLAVGFGADITDSVATTMLTYPDGENASYSTAYNATQNGISGLSNLSGQFGNIGTVGGAVVIILLLVGGFWMFIRGSGAGLR